MTSEKRKIPTANIKAGMVFAAPGDNIPVDIARVTRDSEHTYLRYYVVSHGRQYLRTAKRKTAGRTTVYLSDRQRAMFPELAGRSA